MRPLRIFQAVNSSIIVVHLISRALDRKMIFDDVASNKFRQLLAQQLAFSQIKLVTFCIMGNHWHLLVTLDTAEPNPLQDAPDSVFLDHLGLIYSETEVQKITWQLESFRAGGLEKEAATLRQKECGVVTGRAEDRSRTRGVWLPRKGQTQAQRSAKLVAQSDQRFLDRISQTTPKRQTQRVCSTPGLKPITLPPGGSGQRAQNRSSVQRPGITEVDKPLPSVQALTAVCG